MDGAAGIVLQDNNVLLILRACKPNKDLWALPGGIKEQNESYEDAAKREVEEETGIRVEVIKRFTESPCYLGPVVYFICKPLTFTFKLQTAEVSACMYCSLNSLPANMVQDHLDVLEKLRETM